MFLSIKHIFLDPPVASFIIQHNLLAIVLLINILADNKQKKVQNKVVKILTYS